jgi:hypothetical protein
VRLTAPVVHILSENRQVGSLVWKQDRKAGTTSPSTSPIPITGSSRGLRHPRVAL